MHVIFLLRDMSHVSGVCLRVYPVYISIFFDARGRALDCTHWKVINLYYYLSWWKTKRFSRDFYYWICDICILSIVDKTLSFVRNVGHEYEYIKLNLKLANTVINIVKLKIHLKYVCQHMHFIIKKSKKTENAVIWMIWK